MTSGILGSSECCDNCRTGWVDLLSECLQTVLIVHEGWVILSCCDVSVNRGDPEVVLEDFGLCAYQLIKAVSTMDERFGITAPILFLRGSVRQTQHLWTPTNIQNQTLCLDAQNVDEFVLCHLIKINYQSIKSLLKIFPWKDAKGKRIPERCYIASMRPLSFTHELDLFKIRAINEHLILSIYEHKWNNLSFRALSGFRITFGSTFFLVSAGNSQKPGGKLLAENWLLKNIWWKPQATTNSALSVNLHPRYWLKISHELLSKACFKERR